MANGYNNMVVWNRGFGAKFYLLKDPMDPRYYWTSSEPEKLHTDAPEGPRNERGRRIVKGKYRKHRAAKTRGMIKSFSPKLGVSRNSAREGMAEVALIASTFMYKNSMQYNLWRRIMAKSDEISDALSAYGGLLIAGRIQLSRLANPDSGMRTGYLRDIYLVDAGASPDDVIRDTEESPPLTGKEAKGYRRDPNNAVLSAPKFRRPETLTMPTGFVEEHYLVWAYPERELKDIPAQMNAR